MEKPTSQEGCVEEGVREMSWQLTYKSPKMTRYSNQRNNMIELYSERIGGKSVPFLALVKGGVIADREFSSKAQAKAWAMKYMRKYPR